MFIEDFKQLKKDLSIHQKIIKKADREELKFIKIEKENPDTIKLTSTDGVRLFATTSQVKLRDNLKFNRFIPLEKIDTLKKEIKSQEIEDKEFTKYLMDNPNYPDVKAIRPKYKHHFKIETEDLKRFIRIAKKWGTSYIDFKLARGKLICRVKYYREKYDEYRGKDIAKAKVKIPVIHSTQKYIRFLINPKLLDDIIPAKGIITIKKNKVDEPLLFGNNLIMAIKNK